MIFPFQAVKPSLTPLPVNIRETSAAPGLTVTNFLPLGPAGLRNADPAILRVSVRYRGSATSWS